MEQVTINGERKDASYITVLAAKQINPDSGIVRMQATNASELGKIEEEYFIISYYNHKIKWTYLKQNNFGICFVHLNLYACKVNHTDSK